jgi:hypothetical protein
MSGGNYIDGTVDPNSVGFNPYTNALTYSYTPYTTDPSTVTLGAGTIEGLPTICYFGGLCGAANQAGAQAILQSAGAVADPMFIADFYGASAVAGAALVAGGAVGGGTLTTLAGEDGLGMVGRQAINKMMNATQRELLRDFFKSGRLPQGLSPRTLELYKTLAERAIEAGKDQLGVQAERLAMIVKALR